MELRYLLALVAGSGPTARDVAVALGRVGCAVLVADRDRAYAEATVALVEESRVKAWAFPVDLEDELDRRLLAGRAHDLGGADLLVTVSLSPAGATHLTDLFVGGLERRRGRRECSPGVVRVPAPGADPPAPSPDGPARLMTAYGDSPGLAAAVVDLLGRGSDGESRSLTADR